MIEGPVIDMLNSSGFVESPKSGAWFRKKDGLAISWLVRDQCVKVEAIVGGRGISAYFFGRDLNDPLICDYLEFLLTHKERR